MRSLDILPPLGGGPCAADYATDLYEVLIDPDRGGCEPALNGTGLVINPDRVGLLEALNRAWEKTAALEDTVLIVAYIGHAEVRDKFYLRQVDSMEPVDGLTSVALVDRINELRTRPDVVSGLGLILDTCHSGTGLKEAVDKWFQGSSFHQFNILASASPGELAYKGQFIHRLIDLLNTGDPTTGAETISFERAVEVLDRDGVFEHGQVPIYMSAVAGLYLARNVSADPYLRHPFAGLEPVAVIDDKMEYFQEPSILRMVTNHVEEAANTAVVGLAGSGKSTIVAALTGRRVHREPLIHAVAFLTGSDTTVTVAQQLHDQLRVLHPRFSSAVAAHQNELPLVDYENLPAVDRCLIGPLRHISLDTPVRLVVDGLDQLSDDQLAAVNDVLDQVGGMSQVHLVVTARTTAPLPHVIDEHDIYEVSRADDHQVDTYLSLRKIDDADQRAQVVSKAGGNWLLCERMTTLVLGGNSSNDLPDAQGGLDLAIDQVHREELDDYSAQPSLWNELAPILGVLAHGGEGTPTPLDILASAVGRAGGPINRDHVRQYLERLYGLVIRTRPNEPGEEVRLYHATLSGHIKRRLDIDHGLCLEALLKSISEHAPPSESAIDQDVSSSLYRFAQAVEPVLLWEQGGPDNAFESLNLRQHRRPADNLATWKAWYQRALAKFGAKDCHTLRTRSSIAFWTGEAGNPHEALRLFNELLPDQIAEVGRDHPDTLETRHEIGRWTGETGNPSEARHVLEELLPDQTRKLDKDHRDTLDTRLNIANWAGRAGNLDEALRLSEELLADRKRVLGLHRHDTLRTRSAAAFWTGEAGRPTEALSLFEELLADQTTELGRDHPDTLDTRHNIGRWTGETGNHEAARRVLEELLPDQERVLGRDHPDALDTRLNIANWTGCGGNPDEALRLSEELLSDRERVLGLQHPDTLRTRSAIAFWTGESGHPHEALRMFNELLRYQGTLGRDHPDTLDTRHNIGRWTGETGNLSEALRVLNELLSDRERLLHVDHPDTLSTAAAIAKLRKGESNTEGPKN